MSIDTVTFLSGPCHFERLPPGLTNGVLVGEQESPLVQEVSSSLFPLFLFCYVFGATVPVSLGFTVLFNVG